MNAVPTPSATLVGRIHHRISPSNHVVSKDGRKRRSRPWEGCNDNETGGDSIGGRPNPDNCHRGFVFIPEGETIINAKPKHSPPENPYSARGNEIPLVVPYPSLRVVCAAAASGKLVRISQYSLIHYRGNWGELVTAESWDCVSDLNGNQCREFVAIEVHHFGLSLVPSSHGIDSEEQSNNDVPALTLESLAQKETHEIPSGSKSKKKSIGKDPINVTAVVDAISPILLNGPHEEPFAIMELYSPWVGEDGTDIKSAVAVIRGQKALCVHPAIHPGQSITLIDVVSRKWKVPGEFQKYLNDAGDARSDLYQRLNHRVPDRVLLITEAASISWNDGHDLTPGSFYMSLPSTVESLTSIRGIVKSVHYHSGTSKDGKQSHHVPHFVTLKLLTPVRDGTFEDGPTPMNRGTGNGKVLADDKKLARLYLPKYAMPPNLSLGLQCGAIIRAVNIHLISSTNDGKCELRDQVDGQFYCYVACLRSTVAIERCASESRPSTRSSHPWFVPRQKPMPFSLSPDHRITEICSDPFSTKSSDQYFAEEKLRRDLESLHDDDRILSCESSDQVEHAQPPIYDGERHDSKPSAEHNNSTILSFGKKVDALLAHHHRTVSAEKMNNNVKLSKGCDCLKRNINRINGGKSTLRDPYAEFFDHAHNLPTSMATECGSSRNDFSTYNHFLHSSSTSMPRVVGLESLRNACAQNFINRVALHSTHSVPIDSITTDHEQDDSRIVSGWTSSFNFRGLTLCQVVNDYTRSMKHGKQAGRFNASDGIYVWGNIESDPLDSNSGPGFPSLHDEECLIPLCEIRNETSGKSQDACLTNCNGMRTWIQVDSVVVSCLCLGISRTGLAPNIGGRDSSSLISHGFLPSMRVPGGSTDADGHGFVFVAGNLVFIAAVHIAAKSVVSTDPKRGRRTNAEAFSTMSKPGATDAFDDSTSKHSNSLSVQECLEQTASAEFIEKPVSVVGRLVRQRFSFRKLKPARSGAGCQTVPNHKSYEGWSVVLSHIDPSTDDILDVASVLQTIDVGISVPSEPSTQSYSKALEFAVERLFSPDSGNAAVIALGKAPSKYITPDQVTMALAWWFVSENSSTLPLLSGGWDECHGQIFAGKNSDQPTVHLEIPYPSRTFTKLGYQRFWCNLNEVKSYFVSENRRSQGSSATANSASLETTKTWYSHNLETPRSVKFLPGMLTRRLCRVPPLVVRVPGSREALFSCRNRHSLLTRLKCGGGVPSFTLAELHWDICRALKERNHAHLKPSLLRRIHNAKILGISFCRARVECLQCFKALTTGTSSKKARSNATTATLEGGMGQLDAPELFCPSGCSRSHGALKWECSAIVDDATGQAKVYAEREAALLLLGSTLDVAAVEKGAWMLEDGILFRPAMPSSSYLMECIKDATIKARQCIRDRKAKINETGKNRDLPSTFSLLPVDAKAEYLLHQHCRKWYQNHQQRKVDLFCRCKPLSEEVTNVNKSEIQVAKAWVAKVGLDYGTASTCSLPPLKLTLEDACLAPEESYDDNISGWDLLRSYKDDS